MENDRVQIQLRPINIRSNGKGVAIGGMSTKDAFEVTMPADFNSTVNIDGKLTLTGGLSSALSIANGGTGATTANGMALSHKHLYVSSMSGGSGASGYIKFATIKVSGTYSDSPIEIKIVRRGDFSPTTVFVLLSNANSNDPGINTVYSYGPVNVWVNKSAASTFDLYAWKNGSYDNMSVLDVRYSAYMNDRITATFGDTLVGSVPTTAVMSIRRDTDCVIEQGTSNGWEYTKWNNGKIELYADKSLSFPAGTLQTTNLYRSIVSLDLKSLLTSVLSGTCAIQTNGMIPQVCRHGTTKTTAEIVIVTSRTFDAFTITAPIYIIGKWK